MTIAVLTGRNVTGLQCRFNTRHGSCRTLMRTDPPTSSAMLVPAAVDKVYGEEVERSLAAALTYSAVVFEHDIFFPLPKMISRETARPHHTSCAERSTRGGLISTACAVIGLLGCCPFRFVVSYLFFPALLAVTRPPYCLPNLVHLPASLSLR